MKSILKIAFCSTLLAASTAFTAQAADITALEGSVVLERSGEFLSASLNDKLTAGDKIYAVNGATADVALTSNCSVSLETDKILTVLSTEAGECSSLYSVAGLNADQLSVLGSSNLEASTDIIALVAFVAATGAIVLIDDNDEPSSP